MLAYFKIGDKEYGVNVVVIEPYRSASWHNPSEGELGAGEDVEVYRGMGWLGTVSYDEFLDLLKAEWDDPSLRETEERVQRGLWSRYHEGP